MDTQKAKQLNQEGNVRERVLVAFKGNSRGQVVAGATVLAEVVIFLNPWYRKADKQIFGPFLNLQLAETVNHKRLRFQYTTVGIVEVDAKNFQLIAKDAVNAFVRQSGKPKKEILAALEIGGIYLGEYGERTAAVPVRAA